jgi:predicted amidohydrolase
MIFAMAYEILIKNGTVIGGTASLTRRADVTIAMGKIVELAALSGNPYRTINADRLLLGEGDVVASWSGWLEAALREPDLGRNRGLGEGRQGDEEEKQARHGYPP